MPVLDRSAVEDTSGMDFLAAALGAPRPAASARAFVQTALVPDHVDGGAAAAGKPGRLCSSRTGAVPLHKPAVRTASQEKRHERVATRLVQPRR